MSFSTPAPPALAASVPCLPLATLVAAGNVSPPSPGSSLHFDCSAMPYQHTLGVCHQVSQLLLLRHTGVSISLHQVNPVLRRCLKLLQVTHLFTWAA